MSKTTKLAQKILPIKESAQKPMPTGGKEKYNVIDATLYYDPEETWNRPRGYYMHIDQLSENEYGYTMLIGWGSNFPKSYRGLIKAVKRRSKKADAEAVALFYESYLVKIAEMYGDVVA